MNMIYRTKNVEINGQPRVSILLQDFPNTWFVIGKVSIIEENEFVRLKYRYDIIEGEQPHNIENFEKAIGDFIVWFMTTHKDKLVFKSSSSESESNDE